MNIQELRILGNGLGAEIGAAVLLELQGKHYIPLHDHTGNVECLVDLTGNTFETYHYSAYGRKKTLSTAQPLTLGVFLANA